MEAAQLELLRTDELDIALRLSFLEHCGGAGGVGSSSADDKEARRKEKKKQKDLKVSACGLCHSCHCMATCAVCLRKTLLVMLPPGCAGDGCPKKCAVRLA